MEHASEIIWITSWKKLLYKEVPVTIRYTPYSLSKGQSLRNAFGIGINLIKLRLSYLVKIIVSVVLIFSCIEALVPGNFVRAGLEVNLDYTFIELLLISFASSVYNTISLISNGSVFLACLCLSMLLSSDKKNFLIRYSYKEMIFVAVFITLVGHSLIVIATQGSSLAERVVDLISLHLILVMVLILCKLKGDYAETICGVLPENIVSRFSQFAVLFFFLTVFSSGIRIDRSKESMALIDRVKTTSNISNALLGIVNGSCKAYDEAMMMQYDELSNCSSDTCFVSRPTVFPKQLYFELNDRRNNLKNGDSYIGYYFNPNIKVVKYRNSD